MILCRQNAVHCCMPHGAGRRVVALVALVLASSSVGAQRPASDPHRWATALTLDLGVLPGDFDTDCGSGLKGSEPSFGGGLAVLFRPRRWVVATLDTRVSDVPHSNACKTIIPPIITLILGYYFGREKGSTDVSSRARSDQPIGTQPDIASAPTVEASSSKP